MEKVALICGGRNWSNHIKIRAWIAKLQDCGYSKVVEGGATGADTIARKEAELAGMKVTEIKAQWNKFGKAAGPIRNTEMLDLKPDLVIAFHNDLANSKGTRNMVTQARKAGIKVIIVEE